MGPSLESKFWIQQICSKRLTKVFHRTLSDAFGHSQTIAIRVLGIRSSRLGTILYFFKNLTHLINDQKTFNFKLLVAMPNANALYNQSGCNHCDVLKTEMCQSRGFLNLNSDLQFASINDLNKFI